MKKDETLLMALGELVRKEISADRLMQRVVEATAAQLGADRGTLYLLTESGDELVSVAALLPELRELRVPVGQGIAGYVARTGRFVNIPYCESDARFWPSVDRRTGYTTQSMLTGPLRDTSGALIGVLQFLNKGDSDGIFTEQDEATLGALSAQIAVLLDETTLRRPASRGGAVSAEAPLSDRINRVVGAGAAMREVFRNIRRVAPTEATVLLRGESGTGKTLVARALHHNSRRSDGPFVPLDCTTLPEGLMENELFGHDKGAYTGAHSSKAGKVEAANRGTLFLDEIGDLPLALQSKLLTLLQDRTYTRVGGTSLRKADIRILAATNRDLEELVRQGRFREDLYYRLRVVQLHLPPLRERGREDLQDLIYYFVDLASKRHKRPIREVRPDAMSMLLDYGWPGNVRELEHCIESAVIFANDIITPSTLSLPRPNSTLELRAVDLQSAAAASGRAERSGGSGGCGASGCAVFDDEPTLKALERRYIQHLLERYDNNRSACARVLDIGRNTLLRKIKDHGLES